MKQKNVRLLLAFFVIFCFVFNYYFHTTIKHSSFEFLTTTEPSKYNKAKSTAINVKLKSLGLETQDLENLSKNKYISDFSYKIQTELRYFQDFDSSQWRSDTYMIASIIARRYRVKHIVDIGCGKAYKLSKLYPEFTPIGIDFKYNLEYSRKTYPHIKFIDLDVEKQCKLQVSDNILKNAVVVSSDVIEHLQDPLRCYLQLLTYVAERAKSVVISTPDRVAKYRKAHEMTFVKGPPKNKYHIREWILPELELMMLASNLHVMLSGLQCQIHNGCPERYKRYPDISIAVIVIHNTKTFYKLFTEMTISLTVFVMAHREIEQNMTYTCLTHLNRIQADKVILFIGNSANIEKISVVISKMFKQSEIVLSTNLRSTKERINSEVSKSNENEWFLIVDVNEFVFPTRNPSAPDLSIKDLISLAAFETFNSLSVQTLFMQTEKGEWYSNPQFKVFGKNISASLSRKMTFESPSWTVLNMKVWKGRQELQFQENGGFITGVQFVNQKIYPYGLHGQRYRFLSSAYSSDLDILLSNFNIQSQFSYLFSLGFITMDATDDIIKTAYNY